MMGVSLYTSRIVLEQLGVEDYGIYNVVGGVVTMFSFLNGAMSQSTQRFLSFQLGKNNLENVRNVFENSLFIHLLIAVVVFVLAETIGVWFLNEEMTIPVAKMKSANWVLQFSLFSFMCSIMAVPFNAMIIAYERMNIYAYVSIASTIMKLLIVYLLVIAPNNKLELYAALGFGVTVLEAMFYGLFCKFKFNTFSLKCRRDKKLFKELSGFAGWNLFGNIAWICKGQGVNIVLNIFYGPILNAAYSVSTQVNNAVNTLVQNFTMALNPQLVKNYASEKYSEMNVLIIRSTKFAFMLTLLVAVPIFFNADKILHVWLKTVPPNAIIFTQLITILALVESFGNVMGNAIFASGKIKIYQILVGITILLNLPFSWLVLKNGYNPYCVFIVAIILGCTTVVERLLILKKNIPSFSVRLFIKKVFFRLFLLLIPICAVLWLAYEYDFLTKVNLFINVSLIILTVAIFEFVIGLTKDERNKIISMISQKFVK